MNWYYVEKGRQAGPVPEETLLALIREGTVRLDTLLWREGMEQWKALQDLSGTEPPFLGAVQAALAEAVAEGRPSSVPVGVFPSGEGQALCAECRRALSTGDMIPLGQQWVCVDCKPLLFQRVREGALPLVPLVWGGFWIRLAARIVDGTILQFMESVTEALVDLAFRNGPFQDPERAIKMTFLSNMLLGMIFLTYETFFLGRFGATPGKMVCRLQVVRPTGEGITYLRALGRCFGYMLSLWILAIGCIMAAFDSEKRALHDYAFDTRVVRK